MELNLVNKLKSLEEEHAQFKRMYADLAFENNALKNLIEKKLYGPMKEGMQLGILLISNSSVLVGPVQHLFLVPRRITINANRKMITRLLLVV